MAGKNHSVVVQGIEIHITTRDDEDYISLTDMTKAFADGELLIKSWFRNKNTIEFIGVWERINNPNFNLTGFDQVKAEAGLNRFTMSAKRWAEKTGGIGVISKSGRTGGGTFAHRDIAFEFGSWLSPEFKLYLIKEFQRLKEQEIQSGQLEWNIRRTLVKANYHIHTDAIKTHLIPKEVSGKEAGYIYASEADLLNIALFGKTAKQWRDENPDKDGNIRDYAFVEQLVVLASLESQNALLIEQKKTQAERLTMLNRLAINQMELLIDNPSIKALVNKPLL
ncbi:KilA-N domain-containing protein [Methylovulum psychrotolerans]|uniref:KilA-N domain-containing protein n=1 Tax=Methylovulum psychrotolerans TaxID=1704499 RepID=UPI001BFF3C9B|nr:KilA-N domain-containing protein [Methylovulum psychrotolerans]MBT9099342.1 KilA-N domain-containing protein [Methylovulum psychrotolerans]